MNKLILIYNANNDLKSKAFDFIHKALSPSTYNCDLCSITHGTFKAKENWSSFIKEHKTQIDIYYKNEFEKNFNQSFQYPIILSNINNELNVFLNDTEITHLDEKELILRLKQYLEA